MVVFGGLERRVFHGMMISLVCAWNYYFLGGGGGGGVSNWGGYELRNFLFGDMNGLFFPPKRRFALWTRCSTTWLVFAVFVQGLA